MSNTLKQPLHSLLRPPNINSEIKVRIHKSKSRPAYSSDNRGSAPDETPGLYECIKIKSKDLWCALEAVLANLDGISYSLSGELEDDSEGSFGGGEEENMHAATDQGKKEGQEELCDSSEARTEPGIVVFKAIVQATQDTWSRKARRRAKRQMQEPLNENMGGENASTEVGEMLEKMKGLNNEPGSAKTSHSSAVLPPVPEPTLASNPVLIVEIGAHILHLSESESVSTIEEGSLLHSGLPEFDTKTGSGERRDHRMATDAHPARAWILTCTWIRGGDLRNTLSTSEGEGGRALFEGFWSHVCRKLGGLLSEANVDEGAASISAPAPPGDGDRERKRERKRRRER